MQLLRSANMRTSSHSKRCNFLQYLLIVVIVTLSFLVLSTFFVHSQSDELIRESYNSGKSIFATTWNVAAINNNPFEYWITADSNDYDILMQNITNFVEFPDLHDVPVNQIFTESMFQELLTEFKRFQIVGWNDTAAVWRKDFSKRKIISEFIKDPLLGKKRLISMSDRITNTISDLSSVHFRPTVVNCFNQNLNSVAEWWLLWKKYMFYTEVNNKSSRVGIYSLVPKIKNSKYPSISLEEERISIPLSILSLALFDSILVHMMNSINQKLWQEIRQRICTKCNFHKNDRIIEILLSTYSASDVVFLQEVSGRFFENQSLRNRNIKERFEIVQSKFMDSDRDQNSFILLQKNKFINIQEVTEPILKILKNLSGSHSKSPIVGGDLTAITVVNKITKVKYLLASFHGDTNGLATIPIVNAVHHYATNFQPSTKLLFGLDANTYSNPEKDQLGVTEFAKFYRSKNLNSCYGPHPNPLNFTTFHARTHLQAQLNKAVRFQDRKVKGDRNPKDFILFFKEDFIVLQTWKDNTGSRKYIEDMVFPTYTFPSDHGITSTLLSEK